MGENLKGGSRHKKAKKYSAPSNEKIVMCEENNDEHYAYVSRAYGNGQFGVHIVETDNESNLNHRYLLDVWQMSMYPWADVLFHCTCCRHLPDVLQTSGVFFVCGLPDVYQTSGGRLCLFFWFVCSFGLFLCLFFWFFWFVVLFYVFVVYHTVHVFICSINISLLFF